MVKSLSEPKVGPMRRKFSKIHEHVEFGDVWHAENALGSFVARNVKQYNMAGKDGLLLKAVYNNIALQPGHICENGGR